VGGAYRGRLPQHHLAALRPVGGLSLVSEVVEAGHIEALFRLVAAPTNHVRPAVALASVDVTVVIQRPAPVTVTGLAAVRVVGQVVVLGPALVAVAAYHVALALALSCQHVAALVALCS